MNKNNVKLSKYLAWDAWTITSASLVGLGIIAIFFPWSILDKWEPINGFILTVANYDDLGTFITGVSTPMFGLATIIMLVRTYALQKQQLQEANDGMADQMRLLRKQRFDDNFFRLLENHHRIIEAMDLHKKLKGKNVTIAVKRDCFRTFYFHMKAEVRKIKLEKSKPEYEGKSKKLTIGEVNDIYDATQNFYKADLHHYFRFIYHILKYVKNSNEIDYEEKYKYTSILRATLSPYELVLIYYNCMHQFGDSHFKPLVEEFSFLKNLGKNSSLLFLKGREGKYHELAFASVEQRPKLLKEWKEENLKKQVIN